MTDRPLDLLWYWPFAREEEAPVAHGAVRPGDHLTIQVLDRPGALRPGEQGAVSVVADLPEVGPARTGARWVADRGVTYARRAWRRQRLQRSARFDVVHLMFLNRFTDALALAGRRGSHPPTVASVHDVIPHRGRLPARVERALLALQYRSLDHVVVHDPWVRDRLVGQFGVDRARIHVVPLQVPDFGVREVPEPGSGPPTILCFGTLRSNKGIDVLLDAMQRLPADVRLHVAGRGDAEVESRVRSAARDDPRVIAELGWVDPTRKHDLYRGATVVVLPYTSFESQSAVLHDAYAHRVPVVVSDVGALGRSVAADGTGIVVPPSDAACLAEALEELLGDPGARREAARAADRVAAERSPAAVGAQLRELYGRLAQR